MKVIINFSKGFKNTGKTARMVFLFFLINLALSMVLAVPMYHSLKNSFGQSKVGERMSKGFDYLWWEEFRDEGKGLDKTFTPSIIGKGAILNNLEAFVQMRFFKAPPLVLIVGILYIVLHVFLAGGILSIFNMDTPKFTAKGFFKGAATYFSRFFILMLISWVFFIAAGIFLNEGLNSILDDVADNSLSEITPFYLGLLFSAIIFFLMLFIQMVFDYARIKIVLEDRRNVLKSALEAFGFVFKHPGSTLGLYYLILLIHVVVTIIYIFIKEFIPQSAFIGVLIAFLIQQLFIFALIWVRCWLYSSQMELYRYIK